MFKFLASSLIIFLSYGIVAGQTQLDSLRNKLSSLNNTEDRLETMCLISRLYRESDPDEAITFAKQTIDSATKYRNNKVLARIFEIMGHTLNVHANYSRASYYFKQALEVLDNLTDSLSMARKYHLLAYFDNNAQGDRRYQIRSEYFLKSREISKKIQNAEGAFFANNGLAFTYK